MNIWEKILDKLEDRVNSQSFTTWFRPTALSRDDGEKIYVAVPSQLFANWISKNYMELIRESCGTLDRDGAEVSFVFDEHAAASNHARLVRDRAGAGGDQRASVGARTEW